MVKTESKAIGEHTYTVTQWNATKAMVMKLKLGKYVGGLLEVMTKSSQNMSVTLMRNISNILEKVDPEAFIAFIKEVACSAVRDGERMSTARFDEYFNGDIMEAYQVAFYVLEVNYTDFLTYVLSSLKGKSL